MKRKMLTLWLIFFSAILSMVNTAYGDVVLLEQNLWLLKTDSLGDTIWTKTLDYNATGTFVSETPDKGYIIGTQAGIIKTDSLGETIWTLISLSTVSATYWQSLNHVQLTSDNGYIITGSRPIADTAKRQWENTGVNSFFLTKVDSMGGIAWERTYDWGFNEEAYSVIETRDKGYVVIGQASSEQLPRRRLLLLKTDSNGDTLWSLFYPGKKYATGNCVLESRDANLVAVGHKDGKVLVLKLDQNGKMLWERTFGGEASNTGRFIRNASDSGYIIFGGIRSTLLKLTPEGDSQWIRQVGLESICFDNTLDGGYVLVSTTRNTGPYFDMDLLLFKADSLGNVVWEKNYGGDKDDCGWYVQQTTGGGFIVSGSRDRRIYVAEPILDSLPEEK